MKANTAADFWAKGMKQEGSGCIIWQGSKNKQGYGYYSLMGKTVYAHRYAWTQANAAEIPKKMVVMHSCDNPCCINPAHLSLGSYSQNTADMYGKGRNNRARLTGNIAKTHCPRGHEYAGDNLLVYNGRRSCRQCNYELRRARQGAKRPAINPKPRRAND